MVSNVNITKTSTGKPLAVALCFPVILSVITTFSIEHVENYLLSKSVKLEFE
jgi:hypothetical protein